MNKKRIKYIDIARSFAIIMIVLGHTIGYSNHLVLLNKFISGFHVPLFFILSGYLFDVKDNFSSFFKNKFKRIMIPYLIWSLLFLIPYILFSNDLFNNLGITGIKNIWQLIYNSLYGIGRNFSLRQNSALWFLPALFTMEISFYYIIKYLKKTNNYFLVLISILSINILSSLYLKIYLPWGINTLLNISIFFYIGYLIKTKKLLEIISIKHIIMMLISGIIATFLNIKKVSYMNYNYGLISLVIVSGITIPVVVLYISKKINQSSVLEYIGQNTMSILIFHKIVLLISQSYLGKISLLLKDSNTIIEIILSIIIVIISIIVSIIIGNIIKKICPFLLGIKKEKQ